MPDSYLTLAELAAINAPTDIAELIEANLRFAPEIGLLPARTIDGTTCKALFRTALPTTGYHAVGGGVFVGKSQYALRESQMQYIDGQLRVPKALATGDNRGVGHVLDLELSGQVESAIRKMGAQLFYGQKEWVGKDELGADAKFGDKAGPVGLSDVVPDALIVNAGGTTAKTSSDVWLVNLQDPTMLEILFGKNKVLTSQPWKEVPWTNPDTKETLTAFSNAVEGWQGFQLMNPFVAGVITNLTADNGKTLTPDLGYSLWKKFPSARKPTHAIMCKRDREQYRLSLKTALIPEPVMPDKFIGLPIVETESLRDDMPLSRLVKNA